MKTSHLRTMKLLSYLAFILIVPALLLSACEEEEARPTANVEVALELPMATATTATSTVQATEVTRAPSATPQASPSPTLTATATATRATATPQPALDDVRATMAAVIPLPTPKPSPTLMSEADLRPALLTLDDLSAGWQPTSLASFDAIEDADESTTIFLCQERPRLDKVRVQADFTKGDLGPQLVHQIALYPPGEAAVAFDDFREAAQQCSEVAIGLAGGSRTVLQLAPHSFPELGDEVLAIRLTGRSIPLLGRPRADLVKIRQGDVVITLAHFTLGQLDEQQTEQLARRALQKLRSEVLTSGL